MTKRALKILMQKKKKKNFMHRIGTYHNLLKECHAISDATKFWFRMLKIEKIGKIKWLPVKNKVDQWISVTVYNIKNNLSLLDMSDLFTPNSSPVVKTSRSADSFVEPVSVKEISRKSILYLRSKILNDLDQNIKTSISTKSFKHALKINT